MSNFKYSSDNPSHGGHAPNDLRDAFLEAIWALPTREGGDVEPTVQVDDSEVPIVQICGLLWNCNDALPGWAHDKITELGGRGGSYARAARWFRKRVAD